MSLTRAERRATVDLVERLLDLVEAGELSADGPAERALVLRLEGVALALWETDGHAARSLRTYVTKGKNHG